MQPQIPLLLMLLRTCLILPTLMPPVVAVAKSYAWMLVLELGPCSHVKLVPGVLSSFVKKLVVTISSAVVVPLSAMDVALLMAAQAPKTVFATVKANQVLLSGCDTLGG